MNHPSLPTQQQCLALHLGSWEGLFIELRPQPDLAAGDLVITHQKRSRIEFEQLHQGNSTAIRQTNTYTGINGNFDAPISDPIRFIYQDFAPGLRFFPDGSFSNGRVQLAPFSDFGIEQGFLWQDQKARLVQQFDPSGSLQAITLIREVRGPWTETAAPPGSSLSQSADPISAQLQPLQGQWSGTAMIMTHQDIIPTLVPATMQIQIRDQALQRDLVFQDRQHTWIGQIEPHRVYDPLRKQSWIGLPHAIWVSSPEQLPIPTKHQDRSFSLELSWCPQPDLYLNLIRQYNRQGSWDSIIWLHLSRA